MFLVAVFGLPYLMSKLIRALARSQEAEEARRQQEAAASGQLALPAGQQPIDPSKLDFCRVLFDYHPASQSTGIDLEVKKGDLVAVLSKSDPMGNASEWWLCRSRDGKKGYLPSPYLETIQRRSNQQAITAGSAPGSRTTTLKSGEEGVRTKSLNSVSAPGDAGNVATITKGPKVNGKAGDINPESFQKSAFYS